MWRSWRHGTPCHVMRISQYPDVPLFRRLPDVFAIAVRHIFDDPGIVNLLGCLTTPGRQAELLVWRIVCDEEAAFCLRQLIRARSAGNGLVIPAPARNWGHIRGSRINLLFEIDVCTYRACHDRPFATPTCLGVSRLSTTATQVRDAFLPSRPSGWKPSAVLRPRDRKTTVRRVFAAITEGPAGRPVPSTAATIIGAAVYRASFGRSAVSRRPAPRQISRGPPGSTATPPSSSRRRR